jgi:hypothetical protein
VKSGYKFGRTAYHENEQIVRYLYTQIGFERGERIECVAVCNYSPEERREREGPDFSRFPAV